MSEPFLAEVRIFGFNFPPRGWATCDGQILPINQNQSLYSLLGTTYGGDGRTTFGLPDLRSRTPIHVGGGHALGQKSGVETVALTTDQIPSHTHAMNGTNQSANQPTPAGNLPAAPSASLGNTYAATPLDQPLANAVSIANQGSGQGHNNMQPYTTLNFCIAMQGVFPSRN
jgi:microcystin-dependent protein